MHTIRLWPIVVLSVILVLVVSATVVAQSSASFDLSWNYIGSGTGLATSSSYRVEGTFGQPLAETNKVDSANLRMANGYWVVGASTPVPTPTTPPTPIPTKEPLKFFLPLTEK